MQRFALLAGFVAGLVVLAGSADAAVPAGKKYVIIHADDAGMSHTVNAATIEGMEKGCVSSCSILVPCPWFSEFAEYARQHPDKDYGIHLTLTSEWEHYRWGPVAGREKVPSLCDKDGYLWSGSREAVANAKIEEAEIELRAQIERARQFGVPLSHLDTHMGTLFYRADLLELYVRLSLEYNLPILFSRQATSKAVEMIYPGVKGKGQQFLDLLDSHHLPVLSSIIQFYDDGDHEQRKRRYLDAFEKLPEGVTQIIIHCGVNDAELQGITSSNHLRDSDRRIFTDPQVKAKLDELGVEIITWRQFHEMTGKKYLIIHGDDAGMSRSVNLATIEAMEKGIVSSCSIMVPCPWFTEFAAYTRKHPEKDYGIHLTLNSEWRHYKWGPVAPRSQVPSLIDKEGYLWGGTEGVAANAKAAEVEIELRAQIDRAKQFGVPISHLDTHMGALVTRPDLVEVFVRLGLEYKLPILWFRVVPKEVRDEYPALRGDFAAINTEMRKQGFPLLDSLTTGVGDGEYEVRKAAYLKVIRGLRPGLSQIIIHCGIADEELKASTYSWANRDQDRRIFMDPEVGAEIKKLGIEVVGWKQMREIVGGKEPNVAAKP